jgi:hypothetical protein
MSTACCVQERAPQRSIAIAGNMIDSQIDAASVAAEEIEKRLDSVLRQSVPKDSPTADTPCAAPACPMAGILSARAFQVERLRDRLVDILDRLEL